jgi:hypothetical protein
LVAMVGSISGFAVSLSMGSSEHLSTRPEATGRASVYTRLFNGRFVDPALLAAYGSLSLPGMGDPRCNSSNLRIHLLCLRGEGHPFKRRFFQIIVNLGITALSFLVGSVIRILLGIET